MTKTIFITGAGSGLGKGTALSLARKGHKVIATAEIESQVSELKYIAEKENLPMESIKIDITCEFDRKLVENYDFDVYVANAGRGQSGPISEMPVSIVRDIFETNVFGSLELAQLVAKKLVEKEQGKIIFVSSIAGLATSPYMGAYCSSKYAVEGIAQAMQLELSKHGVQVATINPGPYQTGFNDRMVEAKWKWFDEDKNFSRKQDLLENDKSFEDQYDQDEMIAKMVEIIESEHHKYRNVYPPQSEEQVKQSQQKMWEQSI